MKKKFKTWRKRLGVVCLSLLIDSVRCFIRQTVNKKWSSSSSLIQFHHQCLLLKRNRLRCYLKGDPMSSFSFQLNREFEIPRTLNLFLLNFLHELQELRRRRWFNPLKNVEEEDSMSILFVCFRKQLKWKKKEKGIITDAICEVATMNTQQMILRIPWIDCRRTSNSTSCVSRLFWCCFSTKYKKDLMQKREEIKIKKIFADWREDCRDFR